VPLPSKRDVGMVLTTGSRRQGECGRVKVHTVRSRQAWHSLIAQCQRSIHRQVYKRLMASGVKLRMTGI